MKNNNRISLKMKEMKFNKYAYKKSKQQQIKPKIETLLPSKENKIKTNCK